MDWFLVIVAGLFEVGFASCLSQAKAATGKAVLAWYAGFVLCLIASIVLLIKAAETLPIGTAYAVWTGIGAFGTVIVGIVFFREPADLWRIFFLSTLVLSIVGLKSVSR